MAMVLHWRDFAAGRPYHAALVPLAESRPTAHSHSDFHELLYVTSGSGLHRFAGSSVQQLSPGDLVFIRPHDAHEFSPTGTEGCELINIAFASERWRRFLDYAAVPAAPAWESALTPVLVHATDASVGRAMSQGLADFQATPRWVDLIRIWTAVIPALESALTAPDDRPAWLSAACSAMYAEDNLVLGLGRLRELAAVSEGHLARCMATYFGCSPVEFVNRVRLDHAGNLLATTTDSIGAIAQRCGFSSQAYFAGRFHARFGLAPRDYRDRARRAVVP